MKHHHNLVVLGANLSQANFLHWHRYFIYAYETALRNECGYKGYQPVRSRLAIIRFHLLTKSYSTGTGENMPTRISRLSSTVTSSALAVTERRSHIPALLRA